MINDQIQSDLKKAMLARDEFETTTLKGLKTAIQYARVAQGSDLNEAQIIAVLQKEQKKRKESAELFAKGGNSEQSQKERDEAELIQRYLPQPMSDEELSSLVDKVISSNPGVQMGQVIGLVKSESAGRADGSDIARIVREKLN